MSKERKGYRSQIQAELGAYDSSNVLTFNARGVSSCICLLIHKFVLCVLTLILPLAMGHIFYFHLHGFVRWEVPDCI